MKTSQVSGLRALLAPRSAGRISLIQVAPATIGKVIRGELRLFCGFLRRDPLGNLELRNGRGLVTNMERPFEGGGRCLDLDNAARQFQDLIARRRPGRSVNGNDLDGRAFAEYTPPAPEEL